MVVVPVAARLSHAKECSSCCRWSMLTGAVEFRPACAAAGLLLMVCRVPALHCGGITRALVCCSSTMGLAAFHGFKQHYHHAALSPCSHTTSALLHCDLVTCCTFTSYRKSSCHMDFYASWVGSMDELYVCCQPLVVQECQGRNPLSYMYACTCIAPGPMSHARNARHQFVSVSGCVDGEQSAQTQLSTHAV